MRSDTITSKKLWFAVGACLLAFVYAVLAAWKLPELKGMFETFTGLLEFVSAAYLTGNLANKWITGKVDAGEPVIPPIITKKPAAAKQPLVADPLDKDLPGGAK